ncbi:MAG: TetR/AcrR family transcriptional regulator [Pseudomonadota bacterium]
METLKAHVTSGLRTGTAKRQRGRARAENILNCARTIFIRDGLEGLTTRKIAQELGISLGNLTYYFPNKEKLLRALIEDVLSDYHQAFELERVRFPDDPQGRFLAYLDHLIDDCQNDDSRTFFFQIWALAKHNKVVANLRDEIYRVARADALELISALRPEASGREINEIVTLFVAMIEGLHVVSDISTKVLKRSSKFNRRYRQAIFELVSSHELA